MSIQQIREPIIVCGLVANNVQLTTQRDFLDVATWDDPLAKLPLPPTYSAEFSFMLLSNADLHIADRSFDVGAGTSITDHDLGPADVCQFCGTAWLPGTLKCPACGGDTNYAARAIEYAAKRAGRIVSKTLTVPMVGLARLDVEVEYTTFTFSGTDDVAGMFRHSLWSTEPALWVCKFCGHMVHGYTADCPGCGGKRQPINELATQRRECLWCGGFTMGGYTCPKCNMRLKARDKQRQWSL